MAEQIEEKQKKGMPKHLVTRGEYIANLGGKTIASSIGIGLVLISGLCALLVCIIGWLVITGGFRSDRGMIPFTLMILILLTWGAGYIFGISQRALRAARDIDTGIPLTHHNTEQLPAEEILVRATTEPLQALESVLLRPAVEGDETPKEQLLRGGVPQTED